MVQSTPIATALLEAVGKRAFGTILADPPWRFVNRTGKMAPEHRRLSRYGTLTTAAIMALPVAKLAASASHLYLWVPNALLPDGLRVMEAWGFQYKSNIVRSEEHTSELQSQSNLVCRLLLEKKKKK